MSEAAYRVVRVDPIEQRLVDVAIIALEKVYHADLVIIFLQDERGVFLAPRAGSENEIADWFLATDWRRVARNMKEYR